MRWKTLLLLACAVGLVLYIVLVERNLPTTDERRESSQKVLDLKDTDITGLDLADGDLRWTLRKDDGKWRLRAPMDYPAEESSVSGIISALVTLRKEKTLDSGADLKGFGLEPAAATLKLTTTQGPVTLALGAEVPGADRMAVRWAERGEAYFVGKNLMTSIRKSVDDLRDKAIFAADSAAVARIELTYPSTGKTAAVWKGENGWMLDFPFVDLADPEGVDKLLYNFTGLRAKAFVDDADARGLASLGLDPPRARVVLYDKDKKAVLDAAVGKTPGMPKEEFYVLRGRQVFLVSDAMWDGLDRGMLTIPNPKLFGFSRWEVDRLEIKAGGRSVGAVRNDEGWSVDGKKAGGSAPIDDLLDKLTVLKWMENYKTPALGTEMLTLAISTEKAKVEAKFMADAGDPQSVWAAVTGRPHYWKLEKTFVDPLLEAVAKIK